MIAAVTTGGLVTTNVEVPVRERASVTVTTYVPTDNEVLAAVVTELPVHAYAYGVVPCVTETLMAPLDPPFVVMCVMVPVTPGGDVSVTEAVPVREAASVTVTEYVPAETELIFCVVAPLLHAYVNGLVP